MTADLHTEAIGMVQAVGRLLQMPMLSSPHIKNTTLQCTLAIYVAHYRGQLMQLPDSIGKLCCFYLALTVVGWGRFQIY